MCLHIHVPREPHLLLIEQIRRYLKGTLDLGLILHSSSIHNLVAYSDADWAGCPDTRRSTSGCCVFLGDNLVCWSSHRQPTVSRSSAEAEYRVVATAVAEACWLRQLLHELHRPLDSATIVYCVSVVDMSANPVQHCRTKHIELDIHFVREKVVLGALRVLHVSSSHQFADIFYKRSTYILIHGVQIQSSHWRRPVPMFRLWGRVRGLHEIVFESNTRTGGFLV